MEQKEAMSEWSDHAKKDGAMYIRTLAIRSDFGEVDMESAREKYTEHRDGWEDMEPPFGVAIEHGKEKRWLSTINHGGRDYIQPLTLD